MHYESIDINNMTDEVKEHVTKRIMYISDDVQRYCNEAISNIVFNNNKNISPKEALARLVCNITLRIEVFERCILDEPTLARMLNIHIKLEKEMSEMRGQ